MGSDLDVVLDTGQGAQLGLDHDTVVMGVLDNLAVISMFSAKGLEEASIITR